MNQVSVVMAFWGTIAMALVIYCTRAFPFILFSKREPPGFIRFVEKFIPPMIMAVLIIYCLKDVSFKMPSEGGNWIPALAGCFFTVAAHVWRRNAMISIFGGTAFYMFLLYIL